MLALARYRMLMVDCSSHYQKPRVGELMDKCIGQECHTRYSMSVVDHLAGVSCIRYPVRVGAHLVDTRRLVSAGVVVVRPSALPAWARKALTASKTANPMIMHTYHSSGTESVPSSLHHVGTFDAAAAASVCHPERQWGVGRNGHGLDVLAPDYNRRRAIDSTSEEGVLNAKIP